jgi:hypothetical protein
MVVKGLPCWFRRLTWLLVISSAVLVIHTAF